MTLRTRRPPVRQGAVPDSGTASPERLAEQFGWTLLHRPTRRRRWPAAPLDAGFFNPVHTPALSVVGSAGVRWLRQHADPAQCLPPAARRQLRALILADGESRSETIQLADAAGVWAFRSGEPAHELVYRLRHAGAEAATPRKCVHGVMVEVYGLGVLLLGRSAVGKSELALELITRGHRLVADDVVELTRPARGLLLGECPTLLRGHVEVRGLGILSARRMFGERAIASRQRVDLVIRLRRVSAQPRAVPAERVGARRRTELLLGVAVPTLSLVAGLGHNLAVFVETACRDTWLRLSGENAAAAFAARQQQAIHDKTSA